MAGGIRSPSIEVTEERFPFFIERHELRPDSGGVGAWRGGLGAVCDLVYEGRWPGPAEHRGRRRGGAALRTVRRHRWPAAPLQDSIQRLRADTGVEGSGGGGQPRRPHRLPLFRAAAVTASRKTAIKARLKTGLQERLCDQGINNGDGQPTAIAE